MPMVLWSEEAREEVYQALMHAVKSGEISLPRLDESVRRILSVKIKRGLFNRKLEPVDVVLKSGNKNPVHEQVAERIAREAVTLVRNHNDVLPINPAHHGRVVVLAPPGEFAQRLANEPNITVVIMPFVPGREQRREIAARATLLARDADLLIAAVVNRYHVDIAHSVEASVAHLPVALVSFASPYYLKDMPDVDAYVCTYSYLESAQIAAADAVLGHSHMTGRLPISIPGFYAYGHRVEDRLAGATR
jgi:beta-N-acetylhexosaminidase